MRLGRGRFSSWSNENIKRTCRQAAARSREPGLVLPPIRERSRREPHGTGSAVRTFALFGIFQENARLQSARPANAGVLGESRETWSCSQMRGAKAGLSYCATLQGRRIEVRKITSDWRTLNEKGKLSWLQESFVSGGVKVSLTAAASVEGPLVPIRGPISSFR